MDYGHDLLFGSFITPSAQQPHDPVELARRSEAAGLDLATFQDHPYQPAFLDTWTLMSYAAAVTSRIRLSANVMNLPLRQPAVLARSVASLDLLSGGRIELGIGAGNFWDAIEAMGGRRLAPGEAVEALSEGIDIIRAIWAAGERGGVRLSGKQYQVVGAKRGPAPAHDVGIWVGAYKPRMLRLVGAKADGWLPSLPYLRRGPAELAELNEIIDDAAVAAGRDPRAIRRLLNIGGSAEPEQLAEMALEHGISAFIMMGDDPAALDRYGNEVAPAVRELVERARNTEEPRPFDGAPAAVDLARRAPVSGLWDESTRPSVPARNGVPEPTARGRAVGEHLVEVHDHLRGELDQVRELLAQVCSGAVDAGHARSVLNTMTLRQNNWTLGAYCAAYCTMVTQHHGLEDGAVFPHLRRSDPALGPVIDRLEQEHVIIHEVVEGVDRALVALLHDPEDFTGVQKALDELTDALLSHLAYEEEQIVEPLSRHGFYSGQLR
jgi:alkanesulfonate monooxygenase SsuD/methylene tetrahydromethanopterin reductase-like flavin-dependent oxidoreductase (luciferase family)